MRKIRTTDMGHPFCAHILRIGITLRSWLFAFRFRHQNSLPKLIYTTPLALLLTLTTNAAIPDRATVEILTDDSLVDWPQYTDPDLPGIGTTLIFDERLMVLWAQALEREDLVLRVAAIDAIRQAHLLGVAEAAAQGDYLVQLLAEDRRPQVQQALIQALAQMQMPSASEVLLERAEAAGPTMILLADPVLARFDHLPARTVWLKRLETPDLPGGSGIPLRISAIESLVAVSAGESVPQLRRLVQRPQLDPGLRLAAARGLGRLVSEGLEHLAAALAKGTIPDRLAAASLLSSHDSAETRDVMVNLVMDPEPAVAAIAGRRLVVIDPLLLEGVSRTLAINADPNVRRIAAEAIVLQRRADAVAFLGGMLDDPAPLVRSYVRDQLIALERDPALREPVRAAAASMLDTDQWRGLEQAALLLGRLDHETSAKRLLKLLEHPRAEVQVAAAAALRWLAVPETLAPLHDRVVQFTDAKHAADPADLEMRKYKAINGAKAVQIFQLFGQLKYRTAHDLLMRYVPKSAPVDTEARVAAVWALGYLYEGKENEHLATLLVDRLSDEAGNNPEQVSVRRMCAVSLARMKAHSHLESIRSFYRPNYFDEVVLACRWAVTDLTGIELPPPAPFPVRLEKWFLMPYDEP